MQAGIQQFDLTGRSAIITGGSKGLGEAMAAGLASAGADLLLVSRNEAEVEATAARIASEYGHRALGMLADVTQPQECEAMAARALSEYGKIDILINNAGVNVRGPIDELTYEQFREVQRVNVDGLWLATRAVVPAMKKAQYGRIINMASTLGVVGLENRTPYTASKGAVVQMTRGTDQEVHPGRRRARPLGTHGGDPGGRHLFGQRSGQLHGRQPVDRRRRLDGSLTCSGAVWAARSYF